MAYRELMRRKLLEQMYDKMSHEEKQLFAQLTMQDKSSDEILQALHRQSNDISDIHEKVSKSTWLRDFSSNVAGNAVWDAAVWAFSRLLRKV